ncbi:MAG TPA: hypothetical protein PLA43_07145 [Bryobacteraceae bacterium]|nr:hypothetical protein [Bryobacteraceae bacterium]HOQ43841.1 hypothetical protein [Bryobacteraceae bacterium]HPQ14680.1 hypothetical protein [Bryobacteraceae bacterium]HPU71716.1 hypothetical protein [Bryobacteraceae bacterium]
MHVIYLLLRVFSFCFQGLLIVFLLAASVLAWSSGSLLSIDLLPWTGEALTTWTFVSALAGATVTILALKRIVPVLFLLWNVAVVIMLVRGYFFSSYGFTSGSDLLTALLFILGAVVAAVGSWVHMRRPAGVAARRKAAALV